jgi:hypothetical protein
MLGFTPSLEWWARQGLNLRPHPCERWSAMIYGCEASASRGTQSDSTANKTPFSDHFLTTGGMRSHADQS